MACSSSGKAVAMAAVVLCCTTAVLLAADAPVCADGSCTAPASPDEAVFEVLSPVPETAVEPVVQPPRLKTLDGKTIALVGGSFMASVTHSELKRLILAEHPTAKVYLLGEIGAAGPYPRPGVKRREKDDFESALIKAARNPLGARAFANYWGNPGSAFDPQKCPLARQQAGIARGRVDGEGVKEV